MPIPNSVPGGGVPQRPQRPANGIPARQPQQNRPPRNIGSSGIPSQRDDAVLPSPEIARNPAPARSHTTEYDFDSQQLPETKRQIRREPVSNPYDPEDDDTFSPITVDEQIDEEQNEEDEIRREIEARRRARQNAQQVEPEPVYEEEEFEEEIVETPPSNKRDSKKPPRNKKDKKGQDVFVDEKNLKLKPFGSSHRKIKENDFDKRKNLRKNAAIVQWTVIGLILILIGLGVKSAIFPAKPLTVDEVSQIAIETTGMTNFPLTRGEAYATDFMKAFLTTEDSASSQVLGYFYNGNLAEGSNDNRNVSSGYKQSVLFGPTVYSASALTDYSANYVIGSLVQASLSNGDEGAVDGTEPRWMFFNVNVYYDVKTDRMYITPESPTVVPTTDVGSIADVPNSAPLGTGSSDEAIAAEVQSVVYGFMKGYAESTSENYSSLEQYVINDAPNSLKTGLGNAYRFSGTLENAVQYTAYPTSDPNEVKVLIKVVWNTRLGSDDSTVNANYTSTYVMTLEKQSSKWLVSKFQPLLYVQDNSNE